MATLTYRPPPTLVDPVALIRLAGLLEAQDADLRRHCASIAAQSDVLRWNSRAASAFRAGLDEVSCELLACAQAFGTAAVQLRARALLA